MGLLPIPAPRLTLGASHAGIWRAAASEHSVQPRALPSAPLASGRLSISNLCPPAPDPPVRRPCPHRQRDVGWVWGGRGDGRGGGGVCGWAQHQPISFSRVLQRLLTAGAREATGRTRLTPPGRGGAPMAGNTPGRAPACGQWVPRLNPTRPSKRRRSPSNRRRLPHQRPIPRAIPPPPLDGLGQGFSHATTQRPQWDQDNSPKK